jgi:DsbC/DsbD-like thiol-disulfide interchange protein
MIKGIQLSRLHVFLPVLVSIFLVLAPGSTRAQAVRSGPVEARLVAAEVSVQPGKPFIVALMLKIDPDWHVYWKNPGDSGLPTTLQWDLPEGVTAGPLQWPVPERFESGGLVTYGYSGRVLLMTEMLQERTGQIGSRLVLKARAGWLSCRVECTPGKASLELSLPVLTGVPAADVRWAPSFTEAKSLLPSASSISEFSASVDSREVTLVESGKPPLPDSARLMFYPDASGQVKVSAPQSVTVERSSVRLRLQREAGAGQLKRLSGLLVTTGFGTRSAIELDVPVSGARGAAALIAMLLLAFVGGLILNLMPCVLPVISLKIISFSRQEDGQGLQHGLLFGLGVLVSFWIVAGVLVGLRAGGRLLGWGFQFQDPVVVIVTAVLFFLIGLNLFGVFDVGIILTRLGGALRRNGGDRKSVV